MRRLLRVGPLLLLVALATGALSGCGAGGQRDGLTTEQQAESSRLQQIGKTSNGEWEKLPPADREFLLKMAHGNEQSARMLLLGASGKLRGGPPGRPGRPGQPARPR